MRRFSSLKVNNGTKMCCGPLSLFLFGHRNVPCILPASEQSRPCKQTGIYRPGLREMHRHTPTEHPCERNVREYSILAPWLKTTGQGLPLLWALICTVSSLHPARVVAGLALGFWPLREFFLWQAFVRFCGHKQQSSAPWSPCSEGGLGDFNFFSILF